MTRLTNAQKNTLHHLEINLYQHDSELNKIQRLSYLALGRKMLIEKVKDCNGFELWELKL